MGAGHAWVLVEQSLTQRRLRVAETAGDTWPARSRRATLLDVPVLGEGVILGI